jgi:N-acetylglucosaminyldiphosphoundecaprenol N-acetyl-beta-D-mannosaminyltransferase
MNETMQIDTTEMLGVKVSDLNYDSFLDVIADAIQNEKQIAIGYANAHTLNLCYSDKSLTDILNSMDYVHPDGIGIYIASKYIQGSSKLSSRMTGSDFYPRLTELCVRNGWKVYFFGHSREILERIEGNCPGLSVAGLSEGYNFNDDEVVESINSSEADILIIGLSFPLQEQWIVKNRIRLRSKVILAVGDGIRVFSGDKVRGPVLFRRMGLEWLIRLILNPFGNFNRYIIGNPKFLFRVYTHPKGKN